MTTPTGNTPTISFSYSGAGATVLPLLHGGALKWNVSTLTYSFSTRKSLYVGDYYNDEVAGRYHLSTTQKEAVRNALNKIQEVINIDFVEVKDSTNVAGDMRFGGFDNMPENAYAWGYLPNTQPEGGDVWFSKAIGEVKNWERGSYEFLAIIHEIGHALGLKHSFEGSGSNNSVLDSNLDNYRYTVMSYTDRSDSLYWAGHGKAKNIYADSLMPYDIAALQYLYGKNSSAHASDDVYTFAPHSPFFRTIWDAGGTDEISLSNFSTDCTIDLNAGTFSSIVIPSKSITAKYKGETPTYFGENNLAIAYGVTIEKATGGKGDDSLTGNSSSNTLIGGNGKDILRGGGGDDTLTGGSGNDVFLYAVTDTGADVITDFFDNDTIRFTGFDLTAYTLSTGNGASVGANQVQYSFGADTTTLYFGLDSEADSADLSITLNRVYDPAYITKTRTDITLAVTADSGTASDDLMEGNDNSNSLYGGDGQDQLFGNGGDDFLNGGTGIDVMSGGMGDDSYVVDDTSDKIIEKAGQGEDTVRALIDYKLGATLENIILLGSANLNCTGNKVGNQLIGNDGDNILDGSSGLDSFIGKDGNDTFILDNIAEIVTEASNGGNDTIVLKLKVTGAYTLGDNIENLRIEGSKDFNAIGNILNNSLTGNAKANQLSGLDGDDILDGGKGEDVLIGGKGNDTYRVDKATDVTSEVSDEGIDTVISTAKIYALASNVENLTLEGNAVKGFGNESDNTLLGSDKKNVLDGGDGNDFLDGGAGSDTLTGGRGDDVFSFSSALGSSVDRITDFVSRSDDLYLDRNIFSSIAVGGLTATNFTSGEDVIAGDADDYILFDTLSGKVFYDPDGNGSGTAIHFATLLKASGIALELGSSDIVII